MKKNWGKNINRVKIGLWVVVAGFFMLLIFQNQDFFLGKNTLKLNLYFKAYTSPEIINIFLFFICFLAGLFLAIYFIVTDRIKSKKTIRSLNTTVNSHLDKISALEKELETFKVEGPGTKEPAISLGGGSQASADENK